MSKKMNVGLLVAGALTVLGVAMCFAGPAATPPASIAPATMPRVGTINERFQSYNIEMVEVTGGRFWKPYDSKAEAKQPDGNQPSGMNPSLYEYRSPINLSHARLRKLAAALGPAYVRVSGTWANTTYFHNSDDPVPATPPTGFISNNIGAVKPFLSALPHSLLRVVLFVFFACPHRRPRLARNLWVRFSPTHTSLRSVL